MSWIDELRRVTLPDGRKLIGASFRGVPFFVESVERSGGRRAVVHEFPFRDDPFVEDLGRGARGYRVDGYTLGDDYLAQRDALLDAVEADGVGELVLPYYATVRAICVKYGVRESRVEGGIAVVSLEFAEAPTQTPVPTEVVDAAEKVSESADAAVEATAAELEEQYDDDGLPAFAFETAAAALETAAEFMSEVLGPVITATQELAVFSGHIASLTAQAASLVRTPGDAITGLHEAITGLEETIAAAPGEVMDALIETYDIELESPVITATSTRERELENLTALIAAIRRIVAIEAARLAPLVAYASSEEAAAARDRIAAMLEEQAAGADDTAYPALVDLRSQVLRAVPGGSAFASVVTVNREVPIPSLLLTYQLYGSVDNEADVIARNDIRHPGFVAGTLKVLSDG